MSKPRYQWWSYAKYLTRAYPKLKNDIDSQNGQNLVAGQLSPARQADYDAVTKAIEYTKRLKTGAERLKLIDMVFWKQSHTLDGASCAIGYSYEQGKNFQRDFLRLVGFNRGLEDWK